MAFDGIGTSDEALYWLARIIADHVKSLTLNIH